MKISRSNDSLQIKVENRELKKVDHIKYLGSMLTRDGWLFLKGNQGENC